MACTQSLPVVSPETFGRAQPLNFISSRKAAYCDLRTEHLDLQHGGTKVRARACAFTFIRERERARLSAVIFTAAARFHPREMRIACFTAASRLHDGLAAVHALKIRMTPLMCRVQGMQSFRQVQSTCLTRASYAGTVGVQSSEKPAWQDKIKSLSESSLGIAVRNFPWEKVYVRFGQRILDIVWIIVKWLAIPVLALSTLSELLYTLTAKKDIFIPLGILTGILLAKVVGNASLDVVKELQDGKTSWPLIAMGMFFVLLKLPGPYYPSWAAAFLPHVANAGLVQTAFLFRESRQMSV